MSARLPRACRAALGAVVVLFAVAPAGFAQGLSQPSSPVPVLPDVRTSTLDIVDLNEAPAIARDAVMAMAMLGAYPLDDELRAHPNALLDVRTTAYMLVNLFSPGLFDEFPVPAEQAVPYLAVVTDAEAVGEAPVTVGDLLRWIEAVAGIEAGAGSELNTALQERYPALRAGNLDAPVTRAGAALMLSITLDVLAGPTP